MKTETTLLRYVKYCLCKMSRRSDAKYAFNNYDLKNDIYTVARRTKDSSGTTIGAKLVRKDPNACPRYEQTFCYSGDYRSLF